MIDPRIKSVYVFDNGMAAVFGHDNQQIEEYQGDTGIPEVREKLERAFPVDRWITTEYKHFIRKLGAQITKEFYG